MGFPTSYTDGVRTLPLSPKRVAQKAIFVLFLTKIQLQSNNVYYKVSLYEDFQRHSCSITVPHLTVHSLTVTHSTPHSIAELPRVVSLP